MKSRVNTLKISSDISNSWVEVQWIYLQTFYMFFYREFAILNKAGMGIVTKIWKIYRLQIQFLSDYLSVPMMLIVVGKLNLNFWCIVCNTAE